MSREKTDVILEVVVKHFFIEKEVTSTLVMDSLYSGLKALEGQSKSKKGRAKLMDAEEMPAPIACVEKDMFVLEDDVLLLLKRAAIEPLPPKDEKGPQNRTKVGWGTGYHSLKFESFLNSVMLIGSRYENYCGTLKQFNNFSSLFLNECGSILPLLLRSPRSTQTFEW